MDVPTLFAGGRLCLDFINTSCRRRGVELEFLGDGAALRSWLLLAEGVFERPLCPAEAACESALPRALALRAALRALVQSVLEKTPVPQSALETVNDALRANPTYSQLGVVEGGFAESVAAFEPDDRWMTAIAQDALDLLCRSDLSLLRQCECATCVRVFYDSTKNHRRRWCVEKCSSKTKAAAYYRRKKARTDSAAR